MEKHKKLYRSRTNRVIAGVAGGLGDYFEVDATLIRILLVAFTLAGGSGIILYILAWIIIPEETIVHKHGDSMGHAHRDTDSKSNKESTT